VLQQRLDQAVQRGPVLLEQPHRPLLRAPEQVGDLLVDEPLRLLGIAAHELR
jgi:hypothetical protein